MDAILQLPLDDRIDLVSRVWDAIAATPEQVPTPEWHLKELEERLARPEARYLSWDEVKERLDRDD